MSISTWRWRGRVSAGALLSNLCCTFCCSICSSMGFGGVKQSGTGWKEAGLESLDVYSETRYVNLVVDPART